MRQVYGGGRYDVGLARLDHALEDERCHHMSPFE